MADAPAPDALTGVVTRYMGEALGTVAGEETDPILRPSDHAHFQANACMALGKKLGRNPREVATDVVAAIADDAPFETDIAGPGFINITLSDDAIVERATALGAAADVPVTGTLAGTTYVVEYSQPNVAKEMHVGHLRSTIIGDAVARIAERLGADVIRQNHIGDWGTQFGMLIEYLHDEGITDPTSEIPKLNDLYRGSRAKFDSDEEFADRARKRVVALQAGEEETVAMWRAIVEASQHYFDEVYGKLGVDLRAEHTMGESAYNDDLPTIAADLEERGIAVIDDGALCVYMDEFTSKDDEPLPFMVRKQDGGFGYAATDLGAIRHRVDNLGADAILYFVDFRQALHFDMMFAAARKAGYLPDDVDARHLHIGTVNGPDGKPFKTRSGETVKLIDLIDEAIAAAAAELSDRELPDGVDLDELATMIGVGAIKYADLSANRAKDYVFDPERMVALQGDTAAYIQYANARARSVLAKAEAELGALDPAASTAAELQPQETALTLAIDSFDAVVQAVSESWEPHRLAGLLYDIAKGYNDFYTNCPIITHDDAGVRARRRVLCQLTSRTLEAGLELLGIEAPKRM